MSTPEELEDEYLRRNNYTRRLNEMLWHLAQAEQAVRSAAPAYTPHERIFELLDTVNALLLRDIAHNDRMQATIERLLWGDDQEPQEDEMAILSRAALSRGQP